MNVLVIGAHLDDSVIAVGGIIRRIVDCGGRVDVICFGNSDEDFSDPAEQSTAVQRIKAQAVDAHRILGVTDFTCFDWPDYGVREDREIYRACLGSIRKYRPDVILGHFWAEYFQHHAMARMTADTWWQAGWDVSGDLGPPWLARALYHFEVIHLLPNPTDIVDISDTFERKMEAWRCFGSSSDEIAVGQGDPPVNASAPSRARRYASTGGAFSRQLEARARYYGSLIGCSFAEALKRSDFLPRPVFDVRDL